MSFTIMATITTVNQYHLPFAVFCIAIIQLILPYYHHGHREAQVPHKERKECRPLKQRGSSMPCWLVARFWRTSGVSTVVDHCTTATIGQIPRAQLAGA